MNVSAYRNYAMRIGASAALLTGCSGTPPATGNGLDLIARTAGTGHVDHGKSWMSPLAKSIKKLLYVSDWSTNDVFVYDYEKRTLLGKLTGFNSPYGQCVDSKGNVWITSFGAGAVVEYAHGGSQALATLTTDSQPLGCSVDPTTGNLAVSAQNRIDVFTHARGQSQAYETSLCFPFWSPGYDNAGNLYVEALLYGSARPLSGYSDPLACELPHGGAALRGVHFHGFNIAYPGSVMWDGKHLTLTDQDYSSTHETAIYRVSEDAAGNLTALGKTVLSDDCAILSAQVPQPFIVGKAVVGPNLRCSQYGSGPKFDYWAYPAGGNPKSSLQSPPTDPVGESVSIR